MAGASPPSPSHAGAPRGLQRYGRYILVDRLGTGGMAEVFRAVAIGPEQFQRVVVVKRILPHLSENAGFVRMFVDEATLCGRLSHPNIIQVHEFGKQDGTYFIAMEHVEGQSLAHVLMRLSGKSRHIPVNVAAEIARQSCLGLGYAHALRAPDGAPLGIVHRDATPSNVMLSYAGAVKLLDFGIARVSNEARASSTDAGQVKGKSAYLAPEQLRIGPIDGRVDIWSVGIVLHEALTGRRLFRGTSPLHTMKLIQEMDIPRPSKLNAPVPARLDEIVMRSLQRKPEDRYGSANEMADELEAFLIERRASSQELPRFMHALFADEIAKASDLPYDEIRALASAVAVEAPLVTTELGPPPPPSAESRFVGSGQVTLPSWGDGGRALASQARRRLFLGGGVAAGAVLVAATAWVLRPKPEPVRQIPVAAPAPPSLVPAAAGISVSSEPPGADVFLGSEDRPRGRTPFVLLLPRASEAVELRLAKDGYVPGSIRVVPDADKPALVTLAKAVRPRRAKEGKVRNAIPIDPFK